MARQPRAHAARALAAPTPRVRPPPRAAGNEIGDEGAKELAAALKANATLTMLLLGGACRGAALPTPAGRTAARACTRAGGAACGAPAPSARRTRARRAHTARAPAPRAAGNKIKDQAALAAIESILEANKARPPASVRPAFASGRDPNP